MLKRVAQRECSFPTSGLRLGLPACTPGDPVLDEVCIPPRQSVLEPFSITIVGLPPFDGHGDQFVDGLDIEPELRKPIKISLGVQFLG